MLSVPKMKEKNQKDIKLSEMGMMNLIWCLIRNKVKKARKVQDQIKKRITQEKKSKSLPMLISKME